MQDVYDVFNIAVCLWCVQLSVWEFFQGITRPALTNQNLCCIVAMLPTKGVLSLQAVFLSQAFFIKTSTKLWLKICKFYSSSSIMRRRGWKLRHPMLRIYLDYLASSIGYFLFKCLFWIALYPAYGNGVVKLKFPFRKQSNVVWTYHLS